MRDVKNSIMGRNVVPGDPLFVGVTATLNFRFWYNDQEVLQMHVMEILRVDEWEEQ